MSIASMTFKNRQGLLKLNGRECIAACTVVQAAV